MESLPQKSPPIAPRSVVSTKVSKPLYTPVVGYGPSFVPYGSMLSLNSLILENERPKNKKKKKCKAIKNFFKFMFGCVIPDVKD
ncbi:Oidioi.mRNA.OKI2018_I69.chr1.g1102.t1.cds [Oikopleura dioica]|uniref:Oidioi.mRNA.OKI2018_I69.chr1.g1102.t1.cds n=1 Tax=Oikopleura dioica TaxID=34765 RepID=A0ABN7SQH6_OIKDI|nr:Oidioi.mRNA.OKI2018_I69.chr1.g1102.t1.cds [Oikopleura dioica]